MRLWITTMKAKKTIPSNDNRTISNLFIDLQAVLDENEVKESTVNVVHEALLHYLNIILCT